MKKAIDIICVIILTIIFIPLNFCFALHDDESIGKGGAWESNDVKTEQPTTSENEKSIDRELDKSFKKSSIVIPALEKELEEQGADDPEKNETENSGSPSQ